MLSSKRTDKFFNQVVFNHCNEEAILILKKKLGKLGKLPVRSENIYPLVDRPPAAGPKIGERSKSLNILDFKIDSNLLNNNLSSLLNSYRENLTNPIGISPNDSDKDEKNARFEGLNYEYNQLIKLSLSANVDKEKLMIDMNNLRDQLQIKNIDESNLNDKIEFKIIEISNLELLDLPVGNSTSPNPNTLFGLYSKIYNNLIDKKGVPTANTAFNNINKYNLSVGPAQKQQMRVDICLALLQKYDTEEKKMNYRDLLDIFFIDSEYFNEIMEAYNKEENKKEENKKEEDKERQRDEDEREEDERRQRDDKRRRREDKRQQQENERQQAEDKEIVDDILQKEINLIEDESNQVNYDQNDEYDDEMIAP